MFFMGILYYDSSCARRNHKAIIIWQNFIHMTTTWHWSNPTERLKSTDLVDSCLRLSVFLWFFCIVFVIWFLMLVLTIGWNQLLLSCEITFDYCPNLRTDCTYKLSLHVFLHPPLSPPAAVERDSWACRSWQPPPSLAVLVHLLSLVECAI